MSMSGSVANWQIRKSKKKKKEDEVGRIQAFVLFYKKNLIFMHAAHLVLIRFMA